MNLTHDLYFFQLSHVSFSVPFYANFCTAFDHWFNLIFISKFISCMYTLFGGPFNFSPQ